MARHMKYQLLDGLLRLSGNYCCFYKASFFYFFHNINHMTVVKLVDRLNENKISTFGQALVELLVSEKTL